VNTVIFFLISFAVALTLGLIALEDPGYVLISRQPYEIEVSLALFGVAIVVLFVGLYILVRFILRSFKARRDLAVWQDKRSRVKAVREMQHGYAKLIEGDWAEAERELTQHLSHSDTPLLNLLGAAYAAQQKNDYERRDHYLDQARSSDRKHRDAVDLTRARLQYQAGQFDAVRITLKNMSAALKRRPLVERMEAELLRHDSDWSTLGKRLPLLRKHHAFADPEILELEHQTYSHAFDSATNVEGNSNEITRAWTALPKEQRKDPELTATYVRKLMGADQHKQAEDVIKTALNQHWSGELLKLYAELTNSTDEARLRQCLVWHEKHPEDPDLLQLLGRLKLKLDELEHSQEYFAEAIRQGAGNSAYLELGALLERTGSHADALKCYRRGLEVQTTRP
jgi:HemY protein